MWNQSDKHLDVLINSNISNIILLLHGLDGTSRMDRRNDIYTMKPWFKSWHRHPPCLYILSFSWHLVSFNHCVPSKTLIYTHDQMKVITLKLCYYPKTVLLYNDLLLYLKNIAICLFKTGLVSFYVKKQQPSMEKKSKN